MTAGSPVFRLIMSVFEMNGQSWAGEWVSGKVRVTRTERDSIRFMYPGSRSSSTFLTEGNIAASHVAGQQECAESSVRGYLIPGPGWHEKPM